MGRGLEEEEGMREDRRFAAVLQRSSSHLQPLVSLHHSLASLLSSFFFPIDCVFYFPAYSIERPLLILDLSAVINAAGVGKSTQASHLNSGRFMKIVGKLKQTLII